MKKRMGSKIGTKAKYLSKLKDRLSYYKQVVMNSSDAIIIQDFNGVVKAWNKAAEKIYGFKEKEMIGSKITKIISKENRAEAIKNINSIKNGRPAFKVVQTRIAKNKNKVFVNITYSPIYETGEIIEIATTEENFSALKQKLEDFKKLSLKYSDLFSYMSEAVFIYELKNNGRDVIIKDLNRAAEKLEGVKKKDVIGKKVDIVFKGVKKFGLYDVFKKVWKTKKPIHYPVSLYEDKLRRSWRDNYVFRLPGGEVVAIYSDLTKKISTEESLHQIEKKMATALKSIGDAVIVTNEKGRITFLNSIAQKIIKCPEKIAINQPLDKVFNILNEKTGKKIFNPVSRVIKSGNTTGLGNHTILINRDGKKIPIDDSAAPIKDGNGKVIGAVLVFHDVTENRRASKKLENISNTLRVISKCNESLIRASKESELLNEICKIIIKFGGYRFAWIGYKQNDKNKTVRPVAQCGFEKDYLKLAKITWANNEQGSEPAGMAIRFEKIVISRNILKSSKLKSWQSLAIKRGYASCISLPIFIDGLIGVANIYSSEPEAFNKDEINLLRQLTNDLSYGLKNLKINEERKKNELRFRSYFNLAGAGIAITSPEKGWIEVNDKLCSMLGYTREEIIKKTWAEMTHPDDLAADEKQFNRLLAGEIENYNLDKRFIRKDRSIIWVNLSVGCVRKPDGKVDYVTPFLVDISERKYAEIKLNESYNRYKMIVNNVNDAFYLHDFNGKILDVNENACKMTGYTRKELIGANASIIDTPEQAKFIADRIKKLVKTGKLLFESQHKKKDGTYFWVSVSAKIVSRDNGGIIESFVRDISKNKKIEEELKESEEKYRNLISNLPKTEYVLVHRDGKLLWVNDNTLSFLGVSRVKILKTSVFDYLAREYQKIVLENIKKRASGKKVVDYEIKIKNKFGKFRDVLVKGSIINYENEPAVLLVLSDITERKVSEEKIKSNEERYRIIAEQTGQLVYDYDLSTGQIKWNGPIKKVTGYSVEEFWSFNIKKWERAINPKDRERVEIALDESIKKSKPFNVVYGFKRKDGRYIEVEDNGVFIRKENGKPYRMLGTMANITELIKKDNELKVINTDLVKFKLAVENTTEQVIITDPNGLIIFANKGLELITGYSIKEVIGKKPSLWGGQMSKEFYEELWRAIKDKKTSFIGEVNNKRKNGEIYVAQINIAPILNDDGEVIFFVGIERDITKIKELDRAKSEFVSVASHQLKTPLSGMKWILESILQNKENNLNQKQLEALGDVYKNNENIIKLVNDLLSISRIDSGRYALLNLSNVKMAPLIERAIKNIEILICNKNCKIEFKNYLSLDYSIVIDEEKISQVIMNLITNSIKYSKPEGGLIEVSAKVENKQFLFSVKDNGIGIPIHNQRHIFEKFYRAENASASNTSGTGLGLYIGRYFVEAHKGKMWFESKEGVGTTFYFTLSQDLL